MKKFIFFLVLLFTFSVGAYAVDTGPGSDEKSSYMEDVFQKSDLSATAHNFMIVYLETDVLIRAVPISISFAEYTVLKMPAEIHTMATIDHYGQCYIPLNDPKPDNDRLPSKLLPNTIRNSI